MNYVINKTNIEKKYFYRYASLLMVLAYVSIFKQQESAVSRGLRKILEDQLKEY